MPEDDGVPSGIRTRVAAVKGQRPRPLDDGDQGGLLYKVFLSKSRRKFDLSLTKVSFPFYLLHA